MERVVILGAGGYGSLVEDLVAEVGRWSVEGFVDNDPSLKGREINGIAVLGGDECLPALRKSGVGAAIVALGDNRSRADGFQRALSLGFEMPTVVHPRACVSRRVTLKRGVVVLAGAVIQPGAVIGDNVVVNACASIDHDCVLEDHAQIWPGAHLAGTVHVGAYSYVGTGASVIPGVRIGRDTLVGAGAAVVCDLPDGVVAVGVPARPVKDHPPK